MKKTLVIGLLFISNFIYSQSIQIIDDNEFSFKNNNQAFVLFNVRIIDSTNHYSSEQIQNGTFIPLLHIVRYDNTMTQSWDCEINTPYYIHKRMTNGTWERESNKTIYQWTYLLEISPSKDGYYFESITFRDKAYKSPKIPVFRKIAPENNKLYNYGTIEIYINKSDTSLFVKLLNNEIESANLLEYAKKYYPNIYNAYKDKITDDKLKFFFAHRDEEGEYGLISFFHYWSGLGLYDTYSIGGLMSDVLIFNSKKNGQTPNAYMHFKEFDLPDKFDITYKSNWKKGEQDKPYGLVLANSDENKYFFHTTTTGKSLIEGTCNGTNEPIKICNENATLSGKLNKENNYKIEVRNKKATYYINDIVIGSFEMNYSVSKSCTIGFMVYDKQKVEFYDFQIVEP